jgi:uncharacterized membrane protein
MQALLKRLITSSVCLLLLDYIYLNFMRHEMEMQVVNIQRVVMQMKLVPTILCYMLIIGGLNYFILNRHRPVYEAMLLGWIIYGVYDTTSLAIYKKYKWNLALTDTIWGGVLFGLTTAVVYALEG